MRYLATIVEKATYEVEVEANTEGGAEDVALDVDLGDHRAIEVDSEVISITEMGLKHLPYEVTAGKYEADGEENTKYADSFATMDEALEVFDKCNGYSWQRLSYKGRVLMGVEP